MTHKKRIEQFEDAIKRYHANGFNKSALQRVNARWYMRVGCSQCEVVIIMGKVCHETGCPNSAQRRHHADNEND